MNFEFPAIEKSAPNKKDAGAEVPTGHVRLLPNKETDPSEYIDIEKSFLAKMQDLLAHNPDHTDDVHDFFNDAESVAGANCHKTALYLTGKMSREDLFAHTNHDVETAGHVYVAAEQNTTIIPRISNLQDRDATERYVKNIFLEFSKKELPFRVTFFTKERNGFFPQHSVTVFAVSNKGNWYGFEKEDAYSDKPFQDIDMGKILLKQIVNGLYVGIEVQ